MAAEVFISYSSKDRERVLAFSERLSAAGVSLWIDQAGIAGAQFYGEEIANAIDQCKILILMVTPVSVASDHVLREVYLAMDGKKELLPVFLEATTVPAALRYHLAGIHHIELYHGDEEERFRAILEALAGVGVRVAQALSGAAQAPAETSVLPEPEEERVEAPAASPVPNNLPTQLNRFIGREKEIEEVNALLESTRLLTLTGMGGSGKTRLALRIAGEWVDRYPDGVWLVELAALTTKDAALVTPTVASVVGVREEPGRPMAQTLAEFLRGKTLLLLLDNCEHLIDACARLAETLLRAAPNLRILATSREILGIAGESHWPVPSLSLPDPRRLEGRRGKVAPLVAQYEGVQLFLERARTVLPAFELKEENALAVAQVCRQLDGIPLAIELAAALVRVLKVDQIARRLDDRFRLLRGGSRTAMPRHQTLLAAIDSSYELLKEGEPALLRRLSVFAGGWPMEAAEAVCSGGEVDELEVLDLITRLVDKSLVVVDASDEGDPRYRMLETIRQYSRGKLAETGETAPFQVRHRDWFLDLAEQAEGRLRGPEQGEWLDRLEQEHDNLRLALQHSVESGASECALRLAAALWRFWHVRGYVQEGRERLAAALSAAGADAATPARSGALNGAGALAHDQGDLQQAAAFHEEALAVARECGARDCAAVALNNLGNVALDQGQYAEAAARYQEALALWRELKYKQGIAIVLNNLGSVAQDRGDYAEAASHYQESLALKRELGDEGGIASSLNNLAGVVLMQGDYEKASRLLEESLELFEKLGDLAKRAECLDTLARLAFTQGDLSRAAGLHGESLAVWNRLGNREGIAAALEGLACTRAPQRPGEAARLYGAAEALREVTGSPLSDAERTAYDSAVAAARAGVAPDEWEEAWAEGRRIALQESLDLATELLPGAPAVEA
jgi:predicted ATPase